MRENGRAEPAENVHNRLRSLRMAKGLSRADLSWKAGITRQAIYAIETGKYIPTTAVSLHLAYVLGCQVEDLFSLVSPGEIIEGDFVGSTSIADAECESLRVKVARIGKRFVVRPLSAVSKNLNAGVAADGLLLPSTRTVRRQPAPGNKVRVRLLRDRRTVESEIHVAGCDPAIVLAGDHMHARSDRVTVVEWTMGSAEAIEALKQGEVHVAGLYIGDFHSAEGSLPYLRRHFKGQDVKVITFASWEQGLIVRKKNPKNIRDITDMARKDVLIANREEGAGARLLLDRKLREAGIAQDRIKGYDRIASSHIEIAQLVAEGQAHVGIGLEAAARILGLDFVPLQKERYDLVIPTSHLSGHRGLLALLDTIVNSPFHAEIAAFGRYDMRTTGKNRVLRRA